MAQLDFRVSWGWMSGSARFITVSSAADYGLRESLPVDREAEASYGTPFGSTISMRVATIRALAGTP